MEAVIHFQHADTFFGAEPLAEESRKRVERGRRGLKISERRARGLELLLAVIHLASLFFRGFEALAALA